MTDDFIKVEGDCGEPSFYSGWSSAQEAMAEYLRDHPNGVDEILKWLVEVEADRKKWKRTLKPYQRLYSRISKECSKEGHLQWVGGMCRECHGRYSREANKIEVMAAPPPDPGVLISGR